jgi:hypothetical protein
MSMMWEQRVIAPDVVERKEAANNAQCIDWTEHAVQRRRPEEHPHSEARTHHYQAHFSSHKRMGRRAEGLSRPVRRRGAGSPATANLIR